MNLHIFNPEHDMALAADSPFWTSPHAGRKMRADLGWLPALWAEDGDVVLVDDVPAAEAAVRKLKVRRADVKFITPKDSARELAACMSDIRSVMPWGWDRAIVAQLRRCGIPEMLLPDSGQLDMQREVSDRQTAVDMLADLRKTFGQTCGEAHVIREMNELDGLIDRWTRCVVKAPWSCSGRGVRYVYRDAPDYENSMRWAEKTLKAQGHLTVERYLNKVKDFGMEFYAHEDGRVTYEGLSLFSTVNGAYTGNVLATEREKMDIMQNFINESLLVDIQEFICSWIKQRINGCYVGPFGVDMMIVADGESGFKDASDVGSECGSTEGSESGSTDPSAVGSEDPSAVGSEDPSAVGSEDPSAGCLKLNPCVEINLRRTMGHVALTLSPDEEGRRQNMNISYEGKAYHCRISDDYEMFY